MKLEDIIEKLIKNSHSIYNLYKELKCTFENGIAPKQKVYEIFSFIEFLKHKENKYLDMLRTSYFTKLNEIYLSLRGSFAIYECKILEKYIECGDDALPLLRVLEKINDLVDECYMPLPNICEEDELLYTEEVYSSKNKSQKSAAIYTSVSEHIIDSMFPDLEIESCVKFMNESEYFIDKINDQKLLEKLKKIPYDITFLNPVLEDLFIRDNLINPNHKLFDPSIVYEDCYEEDVLNTAIIEDMSNQFRKQIKEIASKRKTKSNKTALLRAIYISFLYSSLPDNEKENLLIELNDTIEKILYTFEIINVIKEDANKIICYEITDTIGDNDENEYQKVKKDF